MKKNLNKITKSQILLLAVMLTSSLLLLYLTTLKEGMHVDEYYTYGLANHEEDGDIYIAPEYGVKLSAASVFDTYFYADGFSLRNVWLNQSYDVHPPIYYLCVHIFTLVTNHFLALKTGALLNIIFHVLNIGIAYVIMTKMLHKKCNILLGTILYGFAPIVLGNVLFIRMYVLLSTFILALTLLFINAWDEEKRGKTFYLKLGFLSVFGTLVHYYFLIYLFWCCVVWGLRLIGRRRWKELGIYIGTMIASGAVSVAIFPSMLHHIFSGYRGEESFNNLLYTSSFFKNLKAWGKTIDYLYGGYLMVVIIIAVALLIERSRFGNKEKWSGLKKWEIIFIPCILYLVTIARIGIAGYSRYISPVYVICVILLMGLFERASARIENSNIQYLAGVLMIALMLNNSWKSYTWPELYQEAAEGVKAARDYGSDNECIYVFNRVWRSMPSYPEFIQYQQLSFIPDDNLGLLYCEQYSDYDHVVMTFDRNMGEEAIETVLNNMIDRNPGLDSYKQIYAFSYNITYYLE